MSAEKPLSAAKLEKIRRRWTGPLLDHIDWLEAEREALQAKWRQEHEMRCQENCTLYDLMKAEEAKKDEARAEREADRAALRLAAEALEDAICIAQLLAVKDYDAERQAELERLHDKLAAVRARLAG